MIRAIRKRTDSIATSVVAIVLTAMVLACMFASDAILNKIVVPAFFGCMLFALGCAVVSITRNGRRI